MSRLIRKSYAIILYRNLPTHDPDLTSDTFIIPVIEEKPKHMLVEGLYDHPIHF
jgi:hypothetical protein